MSFFTSSMTTTTGTYVPGSADGSVLSSSTLAPTSLQTATPTQDMAIVGALIGIIIILACLLLYLVLPPLLSRLRSLAPISQKRLDSRYKTIEGWLITKV
jgi:hypothetical protein